jgi:hypothetical protein
MLPSLATLNLSNGTQAPQLPVGVGWKSGTTPKDTWKVGGLLKGRCNKYANDIARRLWGHDWHQQSKKERLAFATTILEDIYPSYKTNPGATVDMEQFVTCVEKNLGIATTTAQNDSSSDEDECLAARNRKRATGPPQPSYLITDFPTELLERLMADVVLMSLDPCKSIEDICRISEAFSSVCKNGGIYDLLNTSLGWYGSYNSYNDIPNKQLYEPKNSRAWFMYCCKLYNMYGNVWKPHELNFKATTKTYLAEMSLPDNEEWILDAVIKSYIYATVADSIEKQIEDHFSDLLKTLDDDESNTLDEGDLDDDESNTLDEGDLAYAVGVFGCVEQFEDLHPHESKLKVLRDAMNNKPDAESSNMPMQFYTIIHNSKELVKILRTHSRADIEKEHLCDIKKLFEDASLANIHESIFASDCYNDIAFDNYPNHTFEFMKKLLITWLYLPMLQEYVFDSGDDEAGYSGDEVEYWGYFRRRVNKDQLLTLIV